MSKCSDPTLEPGPVTALDLGDFDGTLEPPVFAPIAQRFADQTHGWLSTLDASIAVLDAESLLDIGSDVLGAIGGGGGGATAVNAEALAHLVAAEDGFAAVRAHVGELKTWLPPDVLKTGEVFLLSFFVTDAGGAPIGGALVTLDVTLAGARTSSATDASGEALLETAPGATVGWTITAAGHAPKDGVVTAAAQITVLRITVP